MTLLHLHPSCCSTCPLTLTSFLALPEHSPFVPQSRVRSLCAKAVSQEPSALCQAMPPTGHVPLLLQQHCCDQGLCNMATMLQ
ncbi:hypothetical protein PAL_GLEAN10001083 [Pteropus alecto]|uniref:Uncharacterized protein n=1 Tax=Pteropus alecto TaxID=9402 RepID=L5L687_PTEAL|nr:hypothetical protein PAL_GLEAN10001083 [Pteropus alecto]